MFDTNIVVIGNVLTAPEWRRTTSSNTLVANFRIASTARRMDRESGRWVDGNHLRVRVSCWRRLAEGVASSVTVGDPVVVTGRLYTRDWTDSDGILRTTYEMEAVAVGHDLSRGRARFFRNKNAATAAAEIPEAEEKVRGESAAVVSDDEIPAVYGDGVPDVGEPDFDDSPVPVINGVATLTATRGGGFEPFDTNVILSGVLPAEESPLSAASREAAQSEAAQSEGAQSEAARGEAAESGSPDKGSEDTGEDEEESEAEEADDVKDPEAGIAVQPVPAPRRARGRSPRRQPVTV